METKIVTGTVDRGVVPASHPSVRLRVDGIVAGELSARPGSFGPGVHTATVASTVTPHPGLDSPRTP